MEEEEESFAAQSDYYDVSKDELLLVGLTVGETLDFALQTGGGYLNSVDEALAIVELGSVRQNDVTLLSTGERRRLSIAEALLSASHMVRIDSWNRGLDSETSSIVLTNITNHVNAVNRRVLLSNVLVGKSDGSTIDQITKPRPGLVAQLRALLKREFRVQSSQYYLQLRLVRFIPHALMLGLLFGNIEDDQLGAYDFLGLLFNLMSAVSLGSLSALPDTVVQQSVIVHQIQLGLRYQPLLWMLSKLCTDTLFLFCECLFVSTPVYLMCSMSGNFAIFVVVLWLLSACTSLFIRVVSLLGSRYTSVIVLQAISGGLVGIFVLLSGFLIPVDKMPYFWSKISILSPFKNAYLGLLANEYKNKELVCNPEERLPPSYTTMKCVDAVTRVCQIDKSDPQGCEDCLEFHWFTLRSSCSEIEGYAACLGENPGYCPPVDTNGSSYLHNLLGTTPDVTNCALTLLVLYSSLALLSMVVCKIALCCSKKPQSEQHQHLIQTNDVGCTDTVSVVSDVESTPLNLNTLPIENMGGQDQDQDQDQHQLSVSLIDDLTPSCEEEINWSNVTYRTIVKGISGSAKRGTMTVIIGESGCGKTTFLRELGKRTASGHIEFPAGPFVYTDTVRESLMFAIRTRNECVSNDEQATTLYREVTSIVGLTEDHLDTEIHNLTEVEKRILLLALNICAGYRLLLVDEPTTGLQSPKEVKVVLATLNLIATHPLLNCAVVCSLHQPTDEQILRAHKLLVVSNGRLVFNEAPSTLSQYLRANGCDPPNEDVQLAEWALHVFHTKPPKNIKNSKKDVRSGPGSDRGKRKRSSGLSWIEVWKSHSNSTPESSVETTVTRDTKSKMHHARTTYYLIRRRLRSARRRPSYPVTRLLLAAAAPAVCGSLFHNMGVDQDSLRGYLSIVIISITLSVVHALTAAAMICGERGVVERERWLYNPIWYSFSVSLTEMPLTATCSFLWWALLFVFNVTVPGSESDTLQGMFLLIVVYGFFCYGITTFGIASGMLSKSLVTAQCLITVLQLVWSLHSGFLIPGSRIPKGLQMFHFVNPFTYYLSGVSEFIFHDTTFHCDDDQIVTVPQPFCNYSSIYEQNHCEWCPFTSGDAFLDFYGWSYNSMIRDLMIILVSVLIFKIFIFFSAKCYRYSK